MAKVSIIIPIFNVENYLDECMHSVINQTLQDIEIVCIDDGSTDLSGVIIDDYAKKDSRIKVIHKQNTGYGNSMNVGIENSTGEYIGIVEPDDYIKLNMYETLYNKAIEDNLDIIKADFCRFKGDENNRKYKYEQLDSSAENYNKIINPKEDICVFDFIMNTWSGIYKRNFIEKYNIRHNETPGASFQDNGFWFQTFALAERIEILNEPFYMNRRDNPNSSVKNKDKVFLMKYEYDFIRNFIENNTEIKNRLLTKYSYKKFQNYMFTYNRIHMDYKYSFLEVFSNEFKIALSNNEIDETMFSKKERKNLYRIIKHQKMFYFGTLLKSFVQKIFRKEKDIGEKTFYLFGIKIVTIQL